MKFYNLDSEFTFGKFKGNTVRQTLDLQASYVDWCAINLDHFYISENVIEQIKTIKPDFVLTELGQQKLNEKYSNWENKQDDYHGDEQPQSYEDWLRDEFGDDAGTAYWNLD